MTYRCVACARWFKSRLAGGGGGCPSCGSGNLREVIAPPRQRRTPAERAQLATGDAIVVIDYPKGKRRERVVPLTSIASTSERLPRPRGLQQQLDGRTSITVAEAKKLGIV